MVDVLMSSESVTVLGGPANVNLEVDFGPQGPRGSNIFSGDVPPDEFFTEEVVAALQPQLYDIYININTDGDGYGQVHQYQYVDDAYSWEELAQLLGPTGPTGPQGPRGLASNITGPTGPTGTQGVTGPTGATGRRSFTSSTTPPASPEEGDGWFNTNNGVTAVYYNDGTSSQWVQIAEGGLRGPQGADIEYSDTAPTGSEQGDIWVDTTDGRVYHYYQDVWVEFL